MTTLNDALAAIAPWIGVEARKLVEFATEDNVGGFHAIRTHQKWSAGSIWGVEGQFMYALTRALKPERVIEIGTWNGCSASHFLSAMLKNEKGQKVGIDVQHHPDGINIPVEAAKHWRFYEREGVDVLASEKLSAQIVFEDASHEFTDTVALLVAILEYVKPKIIISHDAHHPAKRDAVRRAWGLVFGEGKYETALIDPSDCGLAWKVL